MEEVWRGGGQRNAQSNQPSLERLLQKDALLRLGPVDVVFCYLDLELGGIGDGREVIEEGANWLRVVGRRQRVRLMSYNRA